MLTHNFSDLSTKMPLHSSDANVATIPCPNPQCVGGYMRRTDCPQLLKVCPSCDGLGFLGNVADNRKRYYLLRNIASELELQSRIGRGLNTRATGSLAADAKGSSMSESEVLDESDLHEHMCVIPNQVPSCLRIS